MPREACDLLIRAGRLVCPGSGLDGPSSVAVRAGRIAAVGLGLEATDVRMLRDFPGGLIVPGLVDLHAHPGRGGISKYGVDPDTDFLPRGVTTVLSQGDAGAANWDEYLERTIRPSRSRVRLAINLAARGESMPGGCFERLEDADPDRCAAAILRGDGLIWGIAVNTSRLSCGPNDPRTVLERGLKVAEATSRPILYGLRDPSDWPLEQQLGRLRPGDVVTYCYRPGPATILEGRRVHPAVHEARSRGVLFDLGHGMASFAFAVAEAALEDGFPPDTISSDQYVRHRGSRPQHDLPHTLSKLLALGMPEKEVWAAVSSRPAEILGLIEETGTLRLGACADFTVLEPEPRARILKDTLGEGREGVLWKAVATVRAGELIEVRPRPGSAEDPERTGAG